MTITSVKYFRFITFMMLVSVFLPIILANLPRIIANRHILSVLWAVSLLLLKPSIFKNKLLLSSIAYGITMILLLNFFWLKIGEWDKKQIMSEFYNVSMAISIIGYYRIAKDYSGLAKLVKWVFLFIVITSFLSIITSYIDPMYARKLTGLSGIKSSSERLSVLGHKKIGGGGYGFASVIVSLFPILVYYYRNSEKSCWSKKYLVFFFILFLFTLIRVQFFANILISIMIIGLSFWGSKNISKSLFIMGFFTLLVTLVPVQFIVHSLHQAGNLVAPNSDVAFKLNDMAQFLDTAENSGAETEADIRMSRFPLLWKLFISSPLWGRQYGNGHLHWMNKLAVYGLLGTIPFLLILYKYIKNIVTCFDKEFTLYFLLSIFSFVTLGCIKALVGVEVWFVFFIILPGFYYLPLIKKK